MLPRVKIKGRGSGSRIRIKGRDQGSGSRIRIKDWDQGSGSRIRIKEKNIFVLAHLNCDIVVEEQGDV